MKALQRLAFEVASSFHLFSFWYSLCLQLKCRTLKMLLSATKFSWCSIKVYLDYQSSVLILQQSIPERTLVRLELTSWCQALSNHNTLHSLLLATYLGFIWSSLSWCVPAVWPWGEGRGGSVSFQNVKEPLTQWERKRNYLERKNKKRWAALQNSDNLENSVV